MQGIEREVGRPDIKKKQRLREEPNWKLGRKPTADFGHCNS